ncbi:Peptidase S10 serine carboxypeptidase [Penicillium nucicola]|uniref:Peptidase S10 serine carboxypeptidase n=1 Tax=Penicillium nucicola TaxID=1850975 RepID=UPI002544F117|nr:Peptidase S10 serine carboxypeptidase [Penicillium nucicola]KAJ5747765.1 Peptidase S10 serine carboxypeptidase [Penicillium nucicola]
MNISALLYFWNIFWATPAFLFSRTTKSPNVSQFEVHSLPDSPALPTSWAGRLPVPGRADRNDIFFWLFQAEQKTYDDNLIIWFNGGPGCSSLIGLTTGNGPILFDGNSTKLIHNPNSWTKLGNVLYVDQPVGTGFSTASFPYPVKDNARVTDDFTRWLHGFFMYFPHLATKQIHLIGESYAGLYIPYFASELLNSENKLPLDVRSMSLGDGSWGNGAAMSSVAMGAYLKSKAYMLNIPEEILSVFNEADKTCGFNDILAQSAIYPPKHRIHIPGNPENFNLKRRLSRDMNDALDSSCNIFPTTPDEVRISIFNSTCYGHCAAHSTAMDYMTTTSDDGSRKPACYDVYDISHDCSTVSSLPLMAEYFSRADVQSALHVGHSGAFQACNSTILSTLLAADSPVPPEYSILPSLVTKHNVSLHIYNGEWDMLINHIGTELSIQNMTWRGAQGFSQKPIQVFYPDDAAPSLTVNPTGTSAATTTLSTVAATAAPAGTWAMERGVSYHLFRGAGHSVFATKPREMFAFVRDVVVAPRRG